MNNLNTITLAFAFAGISLTSYAQTGKTLSDAQALSLGSDSCFFVTGESYETPRFFKYTSTERGLLQIEGETTDASYLALNADSVEVSCIKTGSSCTIPMTEGATVYVMVSPNAVYEADTRINFYSSFTQNDNAGRGATPNDPIIIEENKSNITTDTTPGFYEFTNYMTYTAKESGALILTCSGYVLTGKYGTSFDEMNASFTTDYKDGHYVGSVPVTAGETICISLSSYTSMVVTAKMSYPEKGSTPSFPLEAVIGSNDVSAEYGEFWYRYEGAAEEGYVTITSEYFIPRGHVSIYNVDNLYTPIAQSETGYYDIRYKASAHTPYLIYILKTEESEDWPNPDSFNLSFSPLQQGESANNPLTIESGKPLELNAMTGVFYYLITIPEGENKMLDVNIEGSAATSCEIKIYDIADGQYYSATGFGSAAKLAKPNHTYMVIVSKNKNGEAIMTPTIRDVKDGESISKPIIAVSGTNNLNKASDIYLTYTATLTGRLSLSLDIPGVEVDFPISENAYDGSYNPFKDGSYTKLDIVAGTKYYIHLSNVESDCTLTLSESEYAIGDTKDLAIEVQGDNVVIAEGQTNTWFSYKVQQNGTLTLSSNIPGDNNTSIYYQREGEQYPSSIVGSNEDGDIIYHATLTVKAGETIYVHLLSASENVGNTIYFQFADFAEGESIETAFELQIGGPEIEIPAPSRTHYQWVRVPLNGTKGVKIMTERFVAGGVYLNTNTDRPFDIEFEADENNEVHTATYESNNPVEALYVCFTSAYGTIKLHAVGFEPVAISNIDADTSTSEVYGVNGIHRSSLQPGINIVRKSDGTILKIKR